MDLRRSDLPESYGRGLLRLPAALGPDVLLGRAGDHQPVLRHTFHRAGSFPLDPRRLRDFGCDPQPLLRHARDCHPAGAAGPGGGAPAGAARGGFEQSGRHRNHEAQRRQRRAAGRNPLSSVLHGKGHPRGGGISDRVRDHRVLRPGDGRLFPRIQQLRSCQSAADPAAYRAGMVFHPLLLDPARGAAAVQFAVPRSGGDGRVGDGAFRTAVAGSERGEVDPLPRYVLQSCAYCFRYRLSRSRLPGYGAYNGVGTVRLLAWQCRPRHGGGAHLHGDLLPVLYPDALVHQYR